MCDRDGTPLVRRPDDEPGAIAHRLDVYHTLTEPLIEHYRGRGLYVGVKADARPAEVFESICLVLAGRN
jgi:adenylate kinase